MKYDSYEGMETKGMVLRIHKSSIYDGDGLRTVVFTKGCPLGCLWCSTPESQKMEKETTLDGETLYGREMTVEEVMVEVRKDIPFYFHSGGGMTVSGGEPLMQAKFVRTLTRRACWEGIDTAMETSLYGAWDHVREISTCLNTIFIDNKLMDEDRHRAYTGVSNKLILENTKRLAELEMDNLKIVIRRPLVPGVNDSQEDLQALGKFLEGLPAIDHLQLLPYHKLGTDTYRKLGRNYQLSGVEIPAHEEMERCRQVTSQYVKTII